MSDLAGDTSLEALRPLESTVLPIELRISRSTGELKFCDMVFVLAILGPSQIESFKLTVGGPVLTDGGFFKGFWGGFDKFDLRACLASY